MDWGSFYLAAAGVVALVIVYLQWASPSQGHARRGEQDDDEAEAVQRAPGRVRAGGDQEEHARAAGRKKLASQQRKEQRRQMLEHQLQLQDERRKREDLVAQDRQRRDELRESEAIVCVHDMLLVVGVHYSF